MSKRRTRRSLSTEHAHQSASRKALAAVSTDSVAVLMDAVQRVLARYPINAPVFHALRHALNVARAVYEADVLHQPWTAFLREPDPRGPHIRRYWNSRYVVFLRRFQQSEHPLVHLSIKRHDQRPHIAYRVIWRIFHRWHGLQGGYL